MNRNIKAKILKERRRKRSWKAKSAGPTKGWSREYADRAKNIDSGVYRLNSVDDKMLKLFGVASHVDDTSQASQNVRRLVLGLGTSIKRSSREEVLEKIDRLTEQASIEHHIVLYDGKFRKIFLFWSNGRYFFLKKEFSMVWKSPYFASRETAFDFWLRFRQQIKWILVERNLIEPKKEIEHPAD